MRKYNTPKARFAEYDLDSIEKICSASILGEYDMTAGADDLTGDAEIDEW